MEQGRADDQQHPTSTYNESTRDGNHGENPEKLTLHEATPLDPLVCSTILAQGTRATSR